MKTRIAGIAVMVLAACGGPPAEPAAAPAAPATPEPPGTAKPAESASPPAELTPPSESAPEPMGKIEEPPPGSPREKLMRAHFKETELIRAAIITGKLNNAVAPAKALTNTEGMGKIPPKGEPAVELIKAASGRIGNSPDAPAVAAATADIGVACGNCHRSTNGPKLQVGKPPAAGTTVASRMARHVWATDRLWEGLYVPSDAAWAAGADALGGDAFPEEVRKKGGVHGRAAADRLATLVATAGSKKTPADRAAVYASMLETCAACHGVMGGGQKK